nr:sigma-54-dependent Fis family transcriptional regulator [Gammaproteobacteria bacterium]NIR97545.1 sigma-54-dependent Fis family transcriptional regulator [Gammaproteobacteria bacterium]NIT63178.1 sigma-54-dependent Fis family transcriptional regulator [Gammaproteobacteria bacterium]NIV20128.1 AAA domain-containing protein [Gammaproteobacteria bacterium]NIX11428.1 AAA domain-containing protein [Gammaproteobacteria bacterium]
LRSELSRSYPVDGMVGHCAGMQEVFERIDKVAPTDTTVLILGESGTGKELVARALHENSMRRDGPIITVNCAAIPENLIESELFGHEKGAFTGAVGSREGLVQAAHRGTLFLDEIGELPPTAQARLLRVLQEGEIRRVGADRARHADVRLVAATHRDLQARVEQGLFRSDLYFRLRVMEIRLPPLRERTGDLPQLTRFLLDKTCTRLNKPPLRLTDEALAAIQQYDWPGNVRELENAIERAVILCDGMTIGPELLAIEKGAAGGGHDGGGPGSAEKLSLDDYFVRFVREHEATMTETELARHLGISRKTLWERRSRLGIPRRRETS